MEKQATTEVCQDDELSVPRAALNKMIKQLIPNIRVANDARELIQNCCTEFIHLVATEANDLCVMQQKKTISPENILEALQVLGFGEYCAEANSVFQEAKAVAAKKKEGRARLENLGIPEEELLRQQQELFEKARIEQAQIEQQQLMHMQQVLQQQQTGQQPTEQQIGSWDGITQPGSHDSGCAGELVISTDPCVSVSATATSCANRFSAFSFPKSSLAEEDDYS